MRSCSGDEVLLWQKAWRVDAATTCYSSLGAILMAVDCERDSSPWRSSAIGGKSRGCQSWRLSTAKKRAADHFVRTAASSAQPQLFRTLLINGPALTDAARPATYPSPLALNPNPKCSTPSMAIQRPGSSCSVGSLWSDDKIPSLIIPRRRLS